MNIKWKAVGKLIKSIINQLLDDLIFNVVIYDVINKNKVIIYPYFID